MSYQGQKNEPSFYPNVNLHCNFFPSYVWYYAVGQSILKSTSQIPKWISLQLTIRPDLDVSWEGLPRDKQYLRKKNVVIFLDSAVKADWYLELGWAPWNLSCFDLKFDDTRISS